MADSMKKLEGTAQVLPEELVDGLNTNIETAVTELVKLIPGHKRVMVGNIIGTLVSDVLRSYRTHVALHGLGREG